MHTNDVSPTSTRFTGWSLLEYPNRFFYNSLLSASADPAAAIDIGLTWTTHWLKKGGAGNSYWWCLTVAEFPTTRLPYILIDDCADHTILQDSHFWPQLRYLDNWTHSLLIMIAWFALIGCDIQDFSTACKNAGHTSSPAWTNADLSWPSTTPRRMKDDVADSTCGWNHFWHI